MSRIRLLLLLALVLGAAQSCEEGTGPVAGVVNVNLTTPNSGADGAIFLTVTGPAVLTSATAGPGLRLFSQPFSTTNHFALTGTLTTGTILQIGVADVGKASSYVATIRDVAASNHQLRPVGGYLLTVSR